MSDRDDATNAEPDALSADEQEELLQEIERNRTLSGRLSVLVSAIAVLFSLYQVWLAARGFIFEVSLPVVGTVRVAALQQLQINALHVVFALTLAFALFLTLMAVWEVVQSVTSSNEPAPCTEQSVTLNEDALRRLEDGEPMTVRRWHGHDLELAGTQVIDVETTEDTEGDER